MSVFRRTSAIGHPSAMGAMRSRRSRILRQVGVGLCTVASLAPTACNRPIFIGNFGMGFDEKGNLVKYRRIPLDRISTLIPAFKPAGEIWKSRYPLHEIAAHNYEDERLAAKSGRALRDLKTFLATRYVDEKLPESGDTPFHCAVRNGYIEPIEILISAGAKGNVANMQGKTPFDLMVETWSKEGIIQVLNFMAVNGYDLRAMEKSGGISAIQWLATHGYHGFIEFLTYQGYPEADRYLPADYIKHPPTVQRGI